MLINQAMITIFTNVFLVHLLRGVADQLTVFKLCRTTGGREQDYGQLEDQSVVIHMHKWV